MSNVNAVSELVFIILFQATFRSQVHPIFWIIFPRQMLLYICHICFK